MNRRTSEPFGREQEARVGMAAWLGLACALGIAVGALQHAFAREPSRPVLVTTRDVERGQPLTRAALDYRDVPERYLEERHVPAEELENVLDAKLAVALRSGAAVLWSDLEGTRPTRLDGSTSPRLRGGAP